MRKIAAVANSNAKKLASQGQLGNITPSYIDKMEMHKAAYLVDHALNAVKESGANIHQAVLTEIVKTANACIPAMSTLLPMDKFAALCDKVLEEAALEVGNGMAKTAAMQKQAEGLEAQMNTGEVNSEDDLQAVLDLLQSLEDGQSVDQLHTQPQDFMVNKFTEQMVGKDPVAMNGEYGFGQNLGYQAPYDMSFAPSAPGEPNSGEDYSPDTFSVLAELKYIDTMNTINKVAGMLEKFVKTAGEAGNTPEVAKQVKDEDTASAAKPAEGMIQAAAKKPDINSTTTKKPNLNSQAVASDVSKNVTEFDAKNAPNLAQGNINPTDGSVKLSALGYDALIAQCQAIFSSK